MHFISDFPHLLKCIRNAFVSTGLHIPDGHVHVHVVREAWKKDSESLTLKVMPHITQSHVQPTAFEKMRVNLAFQLFSEEVLKGIFLFKDHLVKTFKITPSTEKFIQKMERLIFIMTAQIPSKGLKCDSAGAKFLEDFLPFLREWEEHAAKHGGGFLSESTALGLRVTIQSTLSLLSYVTSTLKYTYVLTANLSQDKMKNVFGVVRQTFGSNDHPSPEQFLVVINNMAFYSLARPPKGGNSPPEVVTALLEPCDVPEQKGARVTALVDSLLDEGNLPHAEEVLERHAYLLEYDGMVEKKSDSRLIFYIAGYVVCKSLKKFPCPDCASCLCIMPLQAESNCNSTLTNQSNHGGLLYPSDTLEKLITKLENAFTVFFSRNKLHAESLVSFLLFLQGHELEKVGCIEHRRKLTTAIIKFYTLTRLHFFTKATNKSLSSKREKQKLLKMRRCQ